MIDIWSQKMYNAQSADWLMSLAIFQLYEIRTICMPVCVCVQIISSYNILTRSCWFLHFDVPYFVSPPSIFSVFMIFTDVEPDVKIRSKRNEVDVNLAYIVIEVDFAYASHRQTVQWSSGKYVTQVIVKRGDRHHCYNASKDAWA